MREARSRPDIGGAEIDDDGGLENGGSAGGVSAGRLDTQPLGSSVEPRGRHLRAGAQASTLARTAGGTDICAPCDAPSADEEA